MKYVGVPASELFVENLVLESYELPQIIGFLAEKKNLNAVLLPSAALRGQGTVIHIFKGGVNAIK